MMLKRGLSNIIVAVLIFTALAITLPTLFLHTYVSRVAQEVKAISYLEIEERSKYVDVNATALIGRDGSLYIVVFNRGGKQVIIERILVLLHCSSEGVVIALPDSRTSLEAEGYLEYLVTPNQLPCRGASVGGVYIATAEPRIYSARLYNITYIEEHLLESPVQGALPPRSYRLIPIPQIAEPWNLSKTLEEAGFVLAEVDNPNYPTKLYVGNTEVISRGMYSSRGRWERIEIMEYVTIVIDKSGARNLILGYYPRDPDKYTIMVTNDSSISMRVGGVPRTYCRNMLATRVKIYGFMSTNPSGIVKVFGDASRFGSGGMWIKKPDQDVAEYMFLNRDSRGSVYLEGRADRVEIYCLSSGSYLTENSYDPYVLTMNVVGRSSLGGILINTIDAVYGWRTNQNDMNLLDSSRYPLTLIYKSQDLEIDNNATKAVLVAMNFRFFDNEGNDFDGVTVDKPIVIIGVVDEDGNVIAYRSFSFRELTRYEDTYPPTAQAQSAMAFIPIPPPTSIGLKKFYIFISIQDPYFHGTSNVNLDDVDILIFIESVAVVLYS